MLTNKEIVELGIVDSFIDLKKQLQPAGFDITLKEVYVFKSPGRIDFTNEERKISDVEPLKFDERGYVFLKRGAYKVIFNEYVRIPENIAGICLPRSSLLRSGVTLETALWDPGYEGRSEALLIVENEHGVYLKRNARIGQMIFFKLSNEVKGYEGIYKGENK